MATTGGANIVVDGLVFGYDTGYPLVSGNLDTYKFNLGKPTVNLLEQSGATSLDVRTDIYGNVTKTDLGGGKYRFVNDGTGGTTIRLYCNVNDLTNGNIYGCSISYENFDPGVGTSVTLDWCDVNNTSFSVGTYGTSGRIFISASRGTYDNTYRFFDITIPVSSSIDLFNAQVEAQTPSPFTTNTRSVSGSLIDLTRTTDIDLSNVSFDSNAQMTFDGTDDFIAITNLLASESIGAGTQLTISLWLNCDSYTSRMPFSTGQTGSDRIYYWTVNSVNTWRVGNYVSTTGHGALPPVGTWFNTTLVIDGTNVIGYLNGVEDYTGSYTSFTTADYATFGKHGTRNEYYFDGKIAASKIYNRALTAAEIQQNYNALKERFKI